MPFRVVSDRMRTKITTHRSNREGIEVRVNVSDIDECGTAFVLTGEAEAAVAPI